MDRFRALETFVKIVDAGTLSRAAEAMALSTAVVSRTLAELESHLGTRLMHRSSRRLRLTESGTVFYERAKQLLADLGEAEAIASAATVEPGGMLRIAAPVTFGIIHLAPLWPKFLAAYPKLKLDISLSDRHVDVIDEGFDVAVRIVRTPGPTLIARKLAMTQLLVTASPAYIAARGLPTAPQDLAAHDCINYSYLAPRDEWLLYSTIDGSEHRVGVSCRMYVNNGDTIRDATLAGLGIALQPRFAIADDLARGTLVEALPSYRGPDIGIYAMYPTRRHLSAKVRVFVDFLTAAFAAGVTPKR